MMWKLLTSHSASMPGRLRRSPMATSRRWTWLSTRLLLTKRRSSGLRGAAGRCQHAGGGQPGGAGLQALQAQALGPDRAIAPGVDQHDRHRLDLPARRGRELDGRRIHARDSFQLRG